MGCRPLPAPNSELLTRMLDYWCTLGDDQRLPSRDDLDLDHIKDLLPHIFMVDIDYIDEASYPFLMTYRLIGTAIVQRFNYDATGERLDVNLSDPRERQVYNRYETCVQTSFPCLFADFVHDENGKRKPYERLLLPLSNDGALVDKLLGIVDFDILQEF